MVSGLRPFGLGMDRISQLALTAAANGMPLGFPQGRS
jgi:hypothetical protein